jgi:hypothetical protein
MRREQSPWSLQKIFREGKQKSRATSTPRQDLHHLLNRRPNQFSEREISHLVEYGIFKQINKTMVSKSLNLPSWQRKQNQLGRMIRSDILN